MGWSLDAYDCKTGEYICGFSSDVVDDDFVRRVLRPELLDVPLGLGNFPVERAVYEELRTVMSVDLDFDDADWELAYST